MQRVINRNAFTLTGLAAAIALLPVSVAQADDLGDALAKSKTALELRYRLENVDQTGIANKANASTLRTRLRYTSGEWQQASLMIEMDNVARIGDDRYNDTRNGKGVAPYSYPTVVDPDGTDLNQALIKYMGVTNTPLTLGRQRVNLDNQRWIGSVGWRQNEQTLDGLLVEFKGIDRFTATYGFVSRINRINGPSTGPAVPATAVSEIDGETHLLNLKYVVNEKFTGVAYAYLLDADNLAAASSQSIGLRATGKIPVGETNKFGYSAEFATQSDYKSQPVKYSAGYSLAEVTFGNPTWEVQLGQETLGADTGATLKTNGAAAAQALQTPLATLHKFNGWADKFLSTPGKGLVDTYIGGNLTAAGTGFMLSYHTYGADTGGMDYGTEIDAQIAKTFVKRYTLTLKYADYQADTAAIAVANDTTKVWVMAEAKF